MDLVLGEQSPRAATEVGISAEPHGGSVGEVEININLKPYLSHLPPPPSADLLSAKANTALLQEPNLAGDFELLRWGQMQMAVLVDLFLVISTLTIT